MINIYLKNVIVTVSTWVYLEEFIALTVEFIQHTKIKIQIFSLISLSEWKYPDFISFLILLVYSRGS